MRDEVIKKALMSHAAILCSNFGFDRDDRLMLAWMCLGLPDQPATMRELDIPNLKRFIHVLEGSVFVIELLRQNRRQAHPQ